MDYILKAEKRIKTGTKACKALREAGKLPAVVYSEGKEAELITVSTSEFESTWNKTGESTIISLDGLGKEKAVLIQDVALDPLYDTPVHVDFYAVQTDKPVTVEVALVFEGSAPAEKELGGTLIRVMRTVEVEALPKNLPHEIVIDISALKTFDDQIQMKDVTLPTGVTAVTSPDEVIALVQEVKEEVEEEPTEAEVDFSTIEVEKKGKDEENTEAPETQEA
jgi:large subunit ribosomal protein L25